MCVIWKTLIYSGPQRSRLCWTQSSILLVKIMVLSISKRPCSSYILPEVPLGSGWNRHQNNKWKPNPPPQRSSSNVHTQIKTTIQYGRNKQTQIPNGVNGEETPGERVFPRVDVWVAVTKENVRESFGGVMTRKRGEWWLYQQPRPNRTRHTKMGIWKYRMMKMYLYSDNDLNIWFWFKRFGKWIPQCYINPRRKKTLPFIQ